jgi:hypothetical protein
MRQLVALAALILVLGAVDAAAHAGQSSRGPSAHAAKKCGKHRHHGHKRGKHRHRCRRVGAPSTTGNAGSSPAACNTGLPGRVGGHETEYDIVLTRPSVACGSVIVEQDNFGEDPHDLQLQKAGAPAPSFSFAELAPGGVAKQTVNLSRGTWTLYCSLPGHYALGMHVNLTVD